jgi:glutamate---cysteine ligase / carboxylate-amine ligase
LFSSSISSRALAERLLERLRPHAEQLGSTEQLDGLRDILDNGTGAERQRLVYEVNHDFRELVCDLVEATAG